MDERAMNLRRSLSILSYNNNLYGGFNPYHQNRYLQSVSYPSPLPQQPLLPLPFSASVAPNSATLLPVIKKVAAKKNSVKKRRMKNRKAAAKEAAKAVDAEEDGEEEEEVIVLSPPPSSLPLPRLLLTRRPKATSCFAEADSGTATDDLRRLLRL